MTDNGAVEDNDDWKVPSDDNDGVDDDDHDDVDDDDNDEVMTMIMMTGLTEEIFLVTLQH